MQKQKSSFVNTQESCRVAVVVLGRVGFHVPAFRRKPALDNFPFFVGRDCSETASLSLAADESVFVRVTRSVSKLSESQRSPLRGEQTTSQSSSARFGWLLTGWTVFRDEIALVGQPFAVQTVKSLSWQ